MKVNIYIPTLNAGQKWQETITMLRRQTFPVSRTIIIDSGSTDGTLSQNFIQGFDVLHLDKRDFDHGVLAIWQLRNFLMQIYTFS